MEYKYFDTNEREIQQILDTYSVDDWTICHVSPRGPHDYNLNLILQRESPPKQDTL